MRRYVALTMLAGLGIAGTLAQNSQSKICYLLDGSVDNESFPCNNATTGHTTCCQAGALCWSNGVCQYVNNGIQDYQRVGCTDSTWNDPACLKQCTKYVPDRTAGIRPCDGIEKGNHYCCDDGSKGIGSYQCCKNSTSTFILGTSLPTIQAQMPISQLPTSATSTASSSTISQTTSSTPTNTGAGSNSNSGPSSSTIGLGVGLGVGIPVAALIGGGIFLYIWRQKRKEREANAAASTAGAGSGYGGGSEYPTSTAGGYSHVGSHSPGLTSNGGDAHYNSSEMAKYGGTIPQDQQQWQHYPAEVHGQTRPMEMATSPRTTYELPGDRQ